MIVFMSLEIGSTVEWSKGEKVTHEVYRVQIRDTEDALCQTNAYSTAIDAWRSAADIVAHHKETE